MVSETLGGIKELKVLGRKTTIFKDLKALMIFPFYLLVKHSRGSSIFGRGNSFGALLALAIY